MISNTLQTLKKWRDFNEKDVKIIANKKGDWSIEIRIKHKETSRKTRGFFVL